MSSCLECELAALLASQKQRRCARAVRKAAPVQGRPTIPSIIRLQDVLQVTHFGTALDLYEAKQDFTMLAGHTGMTGNSHTDCETLFQFVRTFLFFVDTNWAAV
jgi:hypothetical protein